MSLDRSASLGKLSTEDWELLQDIADRFEKGWQKAEHTGDNVDLNRFLPPRGHPLRTVALHELIKIDLEMLWKRGRRIDLEQYAEKFPELGPTRDLSPQLIYEEYLVRHRHGDKPALTLYQGRFPNQFHSLQSLATERPVHTQPSAPPAPPGVTPISGPPGPRPRCARPASWRSAASRAWRSAAATS